VSEGAAMYHELRKRGTSAVDLKFPYGPCCTLRRGSALSRPCDRGRRGLPQRDGQKENAGRHRGHSQAELVLTADPAALIGGWPRKGPFFHGASRLTDRSKAIGRRSTTRARPELYFARCGISRCNAAFHIHMRISHEPPARKATPPAAGEEVRSAPGAARQQVLP
jgi:hypothetical protein